jgi:hypothetical protein
MEDTKMLNHNLATLGNGALLIWWGMVIMIDPLTIGMGAIGTGLIMLAVNAARRLNGIPSKMSTTFIGLVALVWGTLDTIFDPRVELSFAMLLVVVGLTTIASLAARPKTG